jgi:hypothetical protein
MKTVAQTLEQLDSTLDTVEELIRELPLSMKNEARLIDMLYDIYETAEEAGYEGAYPTMMNDQQDAVN